MKTTKKIIKTIVYLSVFCMMIYGFVYSCYNTGAEALSNLSIITLACSGCVFLVCCIIYGIGCFSQDITIKVKRWWRRYKAIRERNATKK